MTIDTLAYVAIKEQEIVMHVDNIEIMNDDEKPEKLLGSEEAYFDKLQSLIPYLSTKSATKLDILLETITYINMMQNKLLQKTFILGWNFSEDMETCDTILSGVFM